MQMMPTNEKKTTSEREIKARSFRFMEASPKGVFDRVAPRGSQRAILEDSGCILGGLGLDFERIWG